MAVKKPPGKIAIVNSSAAVIEMLRTLFEAEGYETVTAHIDDIKSGRLDLPQYLKIHRPDVVVYDISIPYDENWTFLSWCETRRRHAAIVLSSPRPTRRN